MSLQHYIYFFYKILQKYILFRSDFFVVTYLGKVTTFFNTKIWYFIMSLQHYIYNNFLTKYYKHIHFFVVNFFVVTYLGSHYIENFKHKNMVF